ncbi:MAG: nicotinate (nicotinamide) nucleotide adenylyltransferase [Pseudomonadota bacterium]
MPQLRPAAHLPPANSRQRIGLFGGSFDPPHAGHMHVADTGLKRLNLDEVWWFPTPGNPLKTPPGEYDARLAAVQILTARNTSMKVSDIEARAHIHYSIDLVRMLKMHCPRAKLVWLMGADSLANFHLWKDWRTMAQLIPIAVIARPGSTLTARTSHFAKVFERARYPRHAARTFANQKAPAWTYIAAPLRHESSTALREA